MAHRSAKNTTVTVVLAIAAIIALALYRGLEMATISAVVLAGIIAPVQLVSSGRFLWAVIAFAVVYITLFLLGFPQLILLTMPFLIFISAKAAIQWQRSRGSKPGNRDRHN